MSSKKIYVVDDDPMYLEMMKDHLSKIENFETKTFPTGESCLDCLDEKPDVVILDYHLNEKVDTAMNGLEVLKKIKVQDYNIPVIMLSSQESYAVAAKTISKGAIHYVIKGDNSFVEVSDLLQKILAERAAH
ncbi:MAG: response regulator [Bacteroidia bacterium]|nr:response regulator [Bacteroidia bacterium]